MEQIKEEELKSLQLELESFQKLAGKSLI